MRCNGYDTCLDTASTIRVTSVGVLLPTSNPSLTSQRSHGTSNPSGVEWMRLSGHTSKDFRPMEIVSPRLRKQRRSRTSTGDLMTRPSFEPYCKRPRLPPSSYSGKRTSTSPPTNGLRTSSEERSLHRRHHDANQQPDKRWEKRPREEVHAAVPPTSRARGAPRGGEHTLDDILDAQCPYHKDMRHTLRNCRDFKHSVGNDRPFQPLPPPPPREDPENLGSLSNRKGEEAERSRASTEKSTSSSADTGRKRIRGSRSSTIVRYWWQQPVLPPCIDGPNTRSPSLGRINGSTSIIQVNTHSSSIQ
jgi:hypothetical protein